MGDLATGKPVKKKKKKKYESKETKIPELN